METALVRRQAAALLERVQAPFTVDDSVLEVLVTTFRDLRTAARSRAGRLSGRPR